MKLIRKDNYMVIFDGDKSDYKRTRLRTTIHELIQEVKDNQWRKDKHYASWLADGFEAIAEFEDLKELEINYPELLL